MEMTSRISGFPSKQPAKRVSARTLIRNLGNSCFRAWIGLVSRRQSPIDRRRISRMRESGESLCSRSLVFNRGFADEHDGNVIAYGINAMALSALQPFPVL